jgi:D-alanine-D-alanine ligase
MGFVDLTAISRVVIAHNPVGAEDDTSTSDVLCDVELVASAVSALGIPHRTCAVSEWRPWRHVPADPETVVFNLIEAPPAMPHVHPAAAAAFELMGLSFTGSPSSVLSLTTDKLATRALLMAEGLPVAPGGRFDPEDPTLLDRIPGPWILKPACEDGSLGLEGDPVCVSREAALARARGLAARFPGQAVVAETFLPGRELNVSLLAREGGVEALPVAEIVYEGFPEGMSRVLGYEAKWHEDSFAYLHTVRHFLENPGDGPLFERIHDLALAVWRIFGLRGYARVDLRLDGAGEPRILEVNANPTLNAGFIAAATKADITTPEVVRRILADAVCGRPQRMPAISPTRRPDASGFRLRRGLDPADRAPIESLIRATGFFNAEELEVAMELVDDQLANGEASHYRFLVGESDDGMAGYACWGPILGTVASADLYWIVVHPDHQRKRAGAALLQAAEDWMASCDRTRVYVETSTRPQYLPTRAFYGACGYDQTAELADFYAPGDGKAVFLKVLQLDQG